MVDVAGRTLRAEEEAALVSRSLSGDTEAFDALVMAYSALVYNLALRQLGDRDEALDLSQEVFLRVYRNLASFRGESSFKTWIYRIVINMGKNRQKWWRARKRDQTVPLERPAMRSDDGEGLAPVETLVDDRNDPEREARNQDLARLVAEGLEVLSMEHRQVLVLRDMEDLSYEEIAGVLSLSEGTVKSRISRARQQLKDILRGKL